MPWGGVDCEPPGFIVKMIGLILVYVISVEKGKGHTLDTAPLSEGTSLQKRSGTARVVD